LNAPRVWLRPPWREPRVPRRCASARRLVVGLRGGAPARDRREAAPARVAVARRPASAADGAPSARLWRPPWRPGSPFV